MRNSEGVDLAKQSLRELGKISRVDVTGIRDDTDGTNTVEIYWKGDGSGQGVPGYYMPKKEQLRVCLKMLRETFDVEDSNLIKGKWAFALRNRPFGDIHGIESQETGKQFLLAELERRLKELM